MARISFVEIILLTFNKSSKTSLKLKAQTWCGDRGHVGERPREGIFQIRQQMFHWPTKSRQPISAEELPLKE